LVGRILAFVSGLLLAAGALLRAEAAQANVTFVRDAETEAVIADYAAPLFAAAGLDPKAVHVYLIDDDSINAFVAGGMNLFIYTGLLLKAESPNQIIGVIAHETGHIMGGHLARAREAVRNATIEAMVACILGVGGAAASGQGGVAGVCQLGQEIAGRSLLYYSRTQESAADQAGLSLLEATGQSPRGILGFLKILEKQEALQVGQQDPYLRSHPLSQDRIEAATFSLEHSPFADQADSPEAMARFHRIKAKLRGYAEAQRLQTYYKADDNSLEARYARVVAYHYRLGQSDKALTLVDGLIAEHPEDPFFQEIKGEILLQKGQARAALPFYAHAVETVPDAALLRLGYGRALSQTQDPALRKTAIGQLEEAVRLEPKYRDGWYWLAIAYGADGRLGQMALALAEEAAAGGGLQATKRARDQAQRAMGMLPEGSPGWLRAQDIFNQMDREED
jgi:predicted Zn-dependent protease